MRIMFIFYILMLFENSIAQQIKQKYFFKEIGWSIELPSDFKVLDSADNATRMQRGIKALEEANDIKADITETRTLIGATKNTYNFFDATIEPFDPANENWDEIEQTLKGLTYKSLAEKMPNAKIDSSSAAYTIDGLSFDRFRITITTENKTLFDMILLTKLYKDYQFGITYLYLDDETRKQIEEMLQNSKFIK